MPRQSLLEKLIHLDLERQSISRCYIYTWFRKFACLGLSRDKANRLPTGKSCFRNSARSASPGNQKTGCPKPIHHFVLPSSQPTSMNFPASRSCKWSCALCCSAPFSLSLFGCVVAQQKSPSKKTFPCPPNKALKSCCPPKMKVSSLPLSLSRSCQDTSFCTIAYLLYRSVHVTMAWCYTMHLGSKALSLAQPKAIARGKQYSDVHKQTTNKQLLNFT